MYFFWILFKILEIIKRLVCYFFVRKKKKKKKEIKNLINMKVVRVIGILVLRKYMGWKYLLKFWN